MTMSASTSAFEAEDYFNQITARNVEAQMAAELTMARNALVRWHEMGRRHDRLRTFEQEGASEDRLLQGFNDLVGEFVVQP